MRVLNIIGEIGYGGAELLTLEIAKRLEGESTQVTIVAIGFCEPELAARIDGRNLSLIRFSARLYSPLNVLRLRRLIKRGRFDVVHVHLFPALYLAALAKMFLGNQGQWIFTEHSTSNGRRRFPWLKPIERWIYGLYDRIICISTSSEQALLQWVPGLGGTTVIENGIDLDRFRLATAANRDSLGLGQGDVMVLMVGAFRTEKNQAILVRAMQHLPAHYMLFLAGEGPEMKAVRALAARLGVEQRVRFLGTVSDVESLLKAADVYVLPSTFEGFGLSAFEAAAAGVPVVYADVPGLGTMFNGAGVPIDPHDANSVAAGILRATSDVELHRQLVAQGSKLASKYDLSVTAGYYRQIYDQASRDAA